MAWSDAAKSFIEWAKSQPFQNVASVLNMMMLAGFLYQSSVSSEREKIDLAAQRVEIQKAAAEQAQAFASAQAKLVEHCCGKMARNDER